MNGTTPTRWMRVALWKYDLIWYWKDPTKKVTPLSDEERLDRFAHPEKKVRQCGSGYYIHYTGLVFDNIKDALWAARIWQNFVDDDIIEVGEYGDPIRKEDRERHLRKILDGRT